MRRHMRQVHMDFHTPEFPKQALKNLDAKQMIEALVYGKVNMVALFAKCHFGNAYYPTKVGHVHEALGDKDFLGEAISLCHEHNIAPLAYYSLGVDIHAYKEHPNWRVHKSPGEELKSEGIWTFVCINSPYKEELVIPQLEEVVEAYDVEALWIDIPFQGAKYECFCPHCQKKYEKMYGKSLVDITKEERESFYQSSVARFIKEVKGIVRAKGKSMDVMLNRGYRLDSSRVFSQENNVGVWESQPKTNYLSHSLVARATRTLDVPVQIMSVRFYQGWGDLTLKPAAQMTTEFAAMIGNGGVAVSGDQMNIDGTLQPAVYDMLRESFSFVEEREEYLRHSESVKDLVLLLPGSDPEKPMPELLGPTLYGAHKMLVESHVQFDILSAFDIHKIWDYKKVIMVGPGDYSQEAIEIVKSFTDEGGDLIVVNDALLQKGVFAIEDVFGINYLEPSVYTVSHYALGKEVKGDNADLILQCRTGAQKVMATSEETKCLADYVYPMVEYDESRFFRNEDCPPPSQKVSPYPFITVHPYGKGRAMYIASDLFNAYWEFNHHWLRKTMEGVIRYLDPKPLVILPNHQRNIEINMMVQSPHQYLLNMIHYQVGHQGAESAIPSIEEVYPMYQVKVKVRLEDVEVVRMVPEGTVLPFEECNGYIEFTVPHIKYMAMIQLTLKGEGSK